MKTAKRFLSTLLITLLILSALSVSALADGPGFAVTPILPENQNPGASGYFNLRVSPGHKQDLLLNVTNAGTEDMQVEVGVANASTSPDGSLEYAIAGIRDESLSYAFEDMAAVEETLLTVAPGETKEIKIALQIPQSAFDGVVAGGIWVKKLPKTEESGQGGPSFVNVYQFAFAVVLHCTDTPVEPAFALVNLDAQLDAAGRATVVASIRNQAPIRAKEIKVNADLYLEGMSDPLFHIEKPAAAMAPHSLWDLQFTDSAGYGIQAGNYTADITMEYEGKAWNFTQALTVEPNQALALNQEAENVTQQAAPFAAATQGGVPVWVLTLCAVGLLLVLVLTALLVVVVRSKKKCQPRSDQ